MSNPSLADQAQDLWHSTPAQKEIVEECDLIKSMLLQKNRAYGNSALEPEMVGGVQVTAELGILVRIGDKWKRWNRAVAGEDEDIVADLIGYLVLLRVARKQAKASRP